MAAFRTVTLPIIAPTVIGAALMSAAISFDDFVITFFTMGSGNTLPTLIWGMMRSLDHTDDQCHRHADPGGDHDVHLARTVADPLSRMSEPPMNTNKLKPKARLAAAKS